MEAYTIARLEYRFHHAKVQGHSQDCKDELRMCSANDDPTTYDEFSKLVEETLEKMMDDGLIEQKEDDPSVQHEPVTEDNIPLETGDDWLAARRKFPAELESGDQWLAMRQCSNP